MALDCYSSMSSLLHGLYTAFTPVVTLFCLDIKHHTSMPNERNRNSASNQDSRVCRVPAVCPGLRLGLEALGVPREERPILATACMAQCESILLTYTAGSMLTSLRLRR